MVEKSSFFQAKIYNNYEVTKLIDKQEPDSDNAPWIIPFMNLDQLTQVSLNYAKKHVNWFCWINKQLIFQLTRRIGCQCSVMWKDIAEHTD